MSQRATEDVNTRFQLKDESLCTCGFFDIPQRHPQTKWEILQSIYLKQTEIFIFNIYISGVLNHKAHS